MEAGAPRRRALARGGGTAPRAPTLDCIGHSGTCVWHASGRCDSLGGCQTVLAPALASPRSVPLPMPLGPSVRAPAHAPGGPSFLPAGRRAPLAPLPPPLGPSTPSTLHSNSAKPQRLGGVSRWPKHLSFGGAISIPHCLAQGGGPATLLTYRGSECWTLCLGTGMPWGR